jgi:ubiquinone/menaquinone biosynthesis C-methylase UbiE
MYTAQSAMYDQIRFSQPAGQTFNSSEQATIARLLGLHPGQTLLDVAAGTGRIATHLASQGAEVFAYDLTPNMLRQARARATEADITNLHYINGNGRQLPFPDRQFDAFDDIANVVLVQAIAVDEDAQLLRVRAAKNGLR